MDIASAYESLLGDLYDGALDTQRWPATLARIAAWIGADGFHFLGWNTSLNVPTFGVVSEQFQSNAMPEYNAYYGAIDPRLKILNREQVGGLVLCQRHFDDSFVRRSEYYQDFLRKYDVRYLAGSTLIRSPDTSVVIAFLRRGKLGPYADEHARRIARLLPHLRRAVSIQHRMGALTSMTDMYRCVIERSRLRLFAVDEDLKILYANEAAESFMAHSDTLATRRGRLYLRVGTEHERLLDAVRKAQTLNRPSLLALAGQSAEARAEYVTVMRLPSGQPLMQSISGGAVLILMSDVHSPPDGSQLAQLFSLTPAETRLAIAIAEGKRVEEYAAEAQLKIATVRTHVRSILSKTNTRRQSDVVRLFSRISTLSDQTRSKSS